MDKNVKYVPIFSYELALFLTHEGWVVHHTAPNKENHNFKVYYFNFAPGIYEDMNKYRSIKEDKPIGQHITKTFKGEPDYSVPIYDNKMVRFLIDLGFKIERVEVYISKVDNSRRRVTYFKYRWGLYHGIQQYMNRQDKIKQKKQISKTQRRLHRMHKSVDRYLIGYNKDTDVVTVAAQVFLVRTDNPDEAVVAYDAKQLKYIADFDGHDLGDNRRYALYAPERKDFANFFSVRCPEHKDFSLNPKVNLTPFVDELNRQQLPLTDRLVAQIENKMQASWYEDFANRNDLIPLDEIKKMIEAHNEEAQTD